MTRRTSIGTALRIATAVGLLLLVAAPRSVAGQGAPVPSTTPLPPSATPTTPATNSTPASTSPATGQVRTPQTSTVAEIAPTPALPRLLVLATGGTIASTAAGPQRSGNELVQAVPELANYADITVEQFASVGSSAMTPDHWLRMAKRINEAFQKDPGLAGVVVTHGTDSMEETAFFLHLTVKDARPVVVVGSMRASTAISADGPANLLAAVRTAVAPAARGKGVLVVLNDWIHSARNVRKEDSNRVDAFRSEWGPIGLVDSDAVIFRQQVLTRHTTTSEFDVSNIDVLPDVGIASDFAGFDGAGMLDWATRGAKGLVLEAFAAGRTSPGATSTIVQVTANGVPVVIASRVPEGRVLDRSFTPAGATASVPMNQAGIIAARDIPTSKARVLLMLALTRTHDAKEIQRMFDTY